MNDLLTIGLAQIDIRLGDVDENLAKHLEWIGRAQDANCDLLVFPELSLTGYRLLHLTPRVALEVGGEGPLRELAEAAGSLSVVLGIVERDSRGRLYNSAACLSEGAVTAVQRKLHLPTYGIFQEGRFFAPGERLRLLELAGQSAGVLICEDLWHPAPARQLAVAGAELLAVISAGPGRVGTADGTASQGIWEALTRAAATQNNCWVLYCNRVGWEEGTFYAGGSHVVEPGGRVRKRAPLLEETLLTARLDMREVMRRRQAMPILVAERHDYEVPE